MSRQASKLLVFFCPALVAAPLSSDPNPPLPPRRRRERLQEGKTVYTSSIGEVDDGDDEGEEEAGGGEGKKKVKAEEEDESGSKFVPVRRRKDEAGIWKREEMWS